MPSPRTPPGDTPHTSHRIWPSRLALAKANTPNHRDGPSLCSARHA